MPLLPFSSYIKQICVRSACAQVFKAAALEKQILPADTQISLLFAEGHCKRCLGSEAKQTNTGGT